MRPAPQTVYLDHNATTPLLPEVRDAMRAAEERAFANPASQHAAGRRARLVLEEAREEIARLLGARDGDRLVFTSGGTEANNLALLGLAGAVENALPQPRGLSPRKGGEFGSTTSLGGSRGKREQEGEPLGDSLRGDKPRGSRPPSAIISAIEHPSVIGAAEELTRRGWNVARWPVDRNGLVEIGALDALLSPDTRLVSVMLGNNETGVLQPLAEAASQVRAAEGRHGTKICLHTDAVQVVGKLPVDFRKLDVDLLSFAAHKFHGPRGIGGLLVRAGVSLAPLLHGGFQQEGLRPGTESPVLAAGMHAALAAFEREAGQRAARMAALRDRWERGVLAFYPQAIVNGGNAPRLPHTSNMAFPGHNRQALLMALDLAGVCCSTGAACASGSSEPSPVLIAMQCPAEVVDSSLRFSLGALTTDAEITAALEVIHKVLTRR